MEQQLYAIAQEMLQRRITRHVTGDHLLPIDQIKRDIQKDADICARLDPSRS